METEGTAQAQIETMDIKGEVSIETFEELARIMRKRDNNSKQLVICIKKGFIACYNKESTEKESEENA